MLVVEIVIFAIVVAPLLVCLFAQALDLYGTYRYAKHSSKFNPKV